MSNELVPYSDIEKMGKAVSQSGLFGVKTEAQAIALMLIAQAYGQHPAIAAMEYHIIAGKPSKKSEAMLASFIQAGGKVQWHKLDDTIADATFSHPSGGELRLSWDIKMAEKAGLLSKDGTLYKKYPRAMLRSRLIAEGVRTIYPAATGGMLAKEEAEDLADTSIDISKSKVEKIVNQVEEAQVTKAEVKEDGKKETEKVRKTSEKTSEELGKTSGEQSGHNGGEPVQQPLPEGHHQIQGVITDMPSSMPVTKDGKDVTKYIFKMADLKLGTFDETIFKGITDIMDFQKDTPILLNIEYKERKSGDKTFRDIVSFSQVTSKQVLI